MQIDNPTIRLRLKLHQIVKLPKTCRAHISVRTGSVWITEDRDIEDIVLVAGQSHLAQGHGDMLIQGLEDADVEIEGAVAVALRHHGK